MKIHEYQGKEILRKFGVTVPRGIPCMSVEEAVKAAETLGGPVWVVKAQIHAGGRGKGGGVKVAKSLAQVKEYAEQIMGMQLITHQTGPEGQKVRRLLIEEGADIKQELYVSMVTDRVSQRVVLMASSEGGMDIEEVAHSNPEKIHQIAIDPSVGLTDAEADEISTKIGVPAGSIADARVQLQGLYKAYWETSTKKIQPKSKRRSSTSPTFPSTATSAAWSTAPAWRWRPWTPSSCSAASLPTSSTWAAAQRLKKLPKRSRSC
jgi:succinyl-CoA synthetase beta subunit